MMSVFSGLWYKHGIWEVCKRRDTYGRVDVSYGLCCTRISDYIIHVFQTITQVHCSTHVKV